MVKNSRPLSSEVPETLSITVPWPPGGVVSPAEGWGAGLGVTAALVPPGVEGTGFW